MKNRETKNRGHRIDVPYISQKGKYPTGCESISTTMLLNYLGYSLSPDDFIENYLNKRDFETRNGVLYGADPRKDFAGSPYAEDGFGCYAPVIVQALNHIFTEIRPAMPEVHVDSKGNAHPEDNADSKDNADQKAVANACYKAVDETGTPMEELCRRYIDNDLPVILWTCIDMREPIVGPSWKLLDTGEDFTWISNEHCLLLVGYDETGYICNDPYEGHGVVTYEKQLMENRHEAQMTMAVGVRKS